MVKKGETNEPVSTPGHSLPDKEREGEEEGEEGGKGDETEMVLSTAPPHIHLSKEGTPSKDNLTGKVMERQTDSNTSES